jgi:hypothetical protein
MTEKRVRGESHRQRQQLRRPIHSYTYRSLMIVHESDRQRGRAIDGGEEAVDGGEEAVD